MGSAPYKVTKHRRASSSPTLGLKSLGKAGLDPRKGWEERGSPGCAPEGLGRGLVPVGTGTAAFREHRGKGLGPNFTQGPGRTRRGQDDANCGFFLLPELPARLGASSLGGEAPTAGKSGIVASPQRRDPSVTAHTPERIPGWNRPPRGAAQRDHTQGRTHPRPFFPGGVLLPGWAGSPECGPGDGSRALSQGCGALSRASSPCSSRGSQSRSSRASPRRRRRWRRCFPGGRTPGTSPSAGTHIPWHLGTAPASGIRCGSARWSPPFPCP